MKTRVNTTLVSVIIMLLIALAVWIAIPYYIKEPSYVSDIGPKAFPRLICISIVALCSLKLILLATKVHKGSYKEIDLKTYGRVGAAMVIAIGTVLLAKWINVIFAATIGATLMLALLRVKNFRYYIAIAVTGSVMYLLLRYVMHTRM